VEEQGREQAWRGGEKREAPADAKTYRSLRPRNAPSALIGARLISIGTHLLSLVYSLKANKKKRWRNRGVSKQGEVEKKRASGHHEDASCCRLHPCMHLLPHQEPLGEREVGEEWEHERDATQEQQDPRAVAKTHRLPPPAPPAPSLPPCTCCRPSTSSPPPSTWRRRESEGAGV